MIEVNIYPRLPEYEYLLELYPPKKGNKYLPEWYKNQNFNTFYDSINSKNNDMQSANNCPAIQDEITQGIIIPSWSDIYIYIDDLGNTNWNVRLGAAIGNQQEWIGRQLEKQSEGMGLNSVENYGVLKLIVPYFFETPKGYGLKFSDPFYHHRRTIRLLPGLIETDIWHGANFPFEFVTPLDKVKDKKIMIKAGEPLIMVTPYKKSNDFKLINNKYNKELDTKQSNNIKLLHSVSENYSRYKTTKKRLG